MIRRSECHDTVPNARRANGLGIVCAQPRPWVCALCTQPNFDSVHCSWTLFMRFSKNNNNNNNNKIK